MNERSRRLFREARDLIPGGVNSPVRACQNVNCEPLFIDSAAGAHIRDVDGEIYVDYVLSWGPLILGHAFPAVTAALLRETPRGTSFGAPCPQEVELARLITDALPSVEMIRMTSSGTEATMSALRVARGVTGRSSILKFIGCYHGHADSFLVAAGSGVATLSIPGAPGVPEQLAEKTLLAPYNDLDAVKEIFKRKGEEIAAIIVEPVAANMGLVLPLPGFLSGLRKLADDYGALLIFDEVITGFRLAYGGAQTRFGIDPDLTTLGKIIGGGLPAGAFGGKRRYMEQVAPAGPIYQAGTLSGNPLVMTAGIATLKELARADYGALEKRSANFARELAGVLAAKEVAVAVPTVASMFAVFFGPRAPLNFEEVKTCDQNRYARYYAQMRERGVYLAPSPFETGMISFAHSDADFAKTLEAAAAVEF